MGRQKDVFKIHWCVHDSYCLKSFFYGSQTYITVLIVGSWSLLCNCYTQSVQGFVGQSLVFFVR